MDSVKEYVNTALRDNPNFQWEWSNDTRWCNYIDFSKYDTLTDEYNIEPFKSAIYWKIHSGTLDKVVFEKKSSGLKRRNFVLLRGTTDDNTAQGVNENEV